MCSIITNISTGIVVVVVVVIVVVGVVVVGAAFVLPDVYKTRS